MAKPISRSLPRSPVTPRTGAVALAVALALTACDNESSPIDAASVADAPTTMTDAPVASDAAPPDASAPDASSPDAAPPCVDDAYEGTNGNDTPALATVLSPGSVSTTDAYLCADTEDWYRVQTIDLRYSDPHIFLRLFANGAPYCPDAGNPSLPSLPENTVTVELYDVTGNTLLGNVTNDMGKVWINANGSEFSQDFLIRVTGPSGVSYPYRTRGWIAECLCEDECES